MTESTYDAAVIAAIGQTIRERLPDYCVTCGVEVEACECDRREECGETFQDCTCPTPTTSTTGRP